MSLKMKAKVLLRSRSLAFLHDGMRLHYRVGSSDPWMIYNHLLKPRYRDEYAPPAEAGPHPGAQRRRRAG